jgi:predicted MPP superfamily phosphohydrolase
MGPKGDTLRILLNHNPDAKDLVRSYEWDLMLCGHTHGGQVCLPFIGAPFAPVRDKRYLHGLYAWNKRWLHISSGVGNLHGIRFNCRPEVSLLTVG